MGLPEYYSTRNHQFRPMVDAYSSHFLAIEANRVDNFLFRVRSLRVASCLIGGLKKAANQGGPIIK